MSRARREELDIPPEVATAVLSTALQLGKALGKDKSEQARITGAFSTAAMEAIEVCSSLHSPGSPVWNEVTGLLGAPERAAALLERVVRLEKLSVSDDAAEYVTAFATSFVSLTFSDSKTALDTKAVLAQVGLLKAHLTANSQSQSSPLAAIAWHRRPGAPKFRISPGIDGTRFLLHVELVGGDEPGDLTATWAVNDGVEVFPLLMPQPGRGWARQAKPADCEWPPGAELRAHLRLRFVTPEGEHGYHYWFPVERHAKGHWQLQTHLGTGVHNPEAF